MRKIETELLAAIRADRVFDKGNTRFDPAVGVVYLHGNAIAKRVAPGVPGDWRFSLAGWNTPTTRSRINAVSTWAAPGHGVFTRKGQAFCSVLGQSAPVTDSQWF